MPVTDSAIAAIRTEKILVNLTGDDMIRSRSRGRKTPSSPISIACDNIRPRPGKSSP